MSKKFYITTPIYYVNDIPHIGHAYTTVAADVLARYFKNKGEDIFFLTGTDEHGAKIVEAAKKAGKEPKEFVNLLALKFRETWKNLNINYTEFFRTTNPAHEKVVQDFISRLKERGFIEKKKYQGLYCVGCEKYLLEDELVGGKCPDHNTVPEKQSEENYFFLLSKLKDPLLEVIEKGDFQIMPESRKNEVISKIKQGLEDVSISRQKVLWGVPFPGDKSQTIYVWIDALINYWSAQKVYNRNDIWPPDIQLMAKDILWFHAIIWPAMLIALDLPLPCRIFAHGFFTVSGQKMSKTCGNVLDPNKLVQKFGTDAVRYALLREFPFGEDGDISEEKIAKRYQSELSNGLGNLVQRTISMINKYQVKIQNSKLKTETQNSKIGKLIEELKFEQALIEINKIVTNLNSYIDQNKPWELAPKAPLSGAKSNQEKLTEVLGFIFKSLDSLILSLSPFLPETSEKMKKQLETLKPEPLFPRIES